jgi:hypothetical protein
MLRSSLFARYRVSRMVFGFASANSKLGSPSPVRCVAFTGSWLARRAEKRSEKTRVLAERGTLRLLLERNVYSSMGRNCNSRYANVKHLGRE